MAVEIIIRIDSTSDEKVRVSSGASAEAQPAASVHSIPIEAAAAGDGPAQVADTQLRARYDELVEQMGDDIKPFPEPKVGGYLSRFKLVIEMNTDERQIISLVSPLAAQSVAWGAPFIYSGPEGKHVVDLPLPAGSDLPAQISESDFIARPPEFFQEGKETLWLQILNLDATMDSDIGPIRIILGETLKREYPDLFRPSLGAAQSLGSSGFPARLFFNPLAIIETPIGAFRAIHGVLSYGRVTNFPPIGTPVSIRECIPLDPVDVIRSQDLGLRSSDNPVGRIVALSHPIDMEMQLEGEKAYEFVERACNASRESGIYGPGATA